MIERIEGMMKMMTTTELAETFDTTPRTLRKFLRSDASGIESVGKGARYSLPSSKREVNALSKRFAAWKDAIEAKKSSNDDATDSNESSTDDD